MVRNIGISMIVFERFGMSLSTKPAIFWRRFNLIVPKLRENEREEIKSHSVVKKK